MAKQLSFTKFEQQIVPGFRQKINLAESTEDVKKFFVYSANRLMEKIFEDKIRFEYGDIMLAPLNEPGYTLSPRLRSSEAFLSMWQESDLPDVLNRLADSAVGRYRRLMKNPEKTESKIRM